MKRLVHTWARRRRYADAGAQARPAAAHRSCDRLLRRAVRSRHRLRSRAAEVVKAGGSSVGTSFQYIRWFEEIGLDDVPSVGGKTASLGEMYRALRSRGIADDKR